jgi:hypothetical protein
MVDLMGTLGLDKVDDPDNMPDGKYYGIIKQCEYMKSKTDKLGITVVYKVDDPGSKQQGREKFDWTTVGEGNVHQEGDDWKFDKGSMSEAQKPYFKKRMAALGIPESVLADLKDEHLKSRVGLRVVFEIKNKDGYNNVVSVELRGDNAPVDPFAGNPAATPSAPSTSPSAGLADDI